MVNCDCEIYRSVFGGPAVVFSRIFVKIKIKIFTCVATANRYPGALIHRTAT